VRSRGQCEALGDLIYIRLHASQVSTDYAQLGILSQKVVARGIMHARQKVSEGKGKSKASKGAHAKCRCTTFQRPGKAVRPKRHETSEAQISAKSGCGC